MLFVCCFNKLYGQQTIDSTLNHYYSNYQPERLHFHLDKDAYTSGDTIWFKVYVMAGFKDSQISDNIYVDWIDDNAKILTHQLYPISSSGITCGLYAIPPNFSGNVLHLHAYTKWMLNFDSAFIYNRDINIARRSNSLENTLTKSSTSNAINKIATSASISHSSSPAIHPTLTFFPEGGNMVTDIGSRIAFLCCDQWGRPIAISGEVKDSKGNQVADFKTKHDGMGDFGILPNGGEIYTANWKDEQGSTHQTALPSVTQNRVVLSIKDDTGDNKKFVIQRSVNVPDNLKQLHIIAMMRQLPVYSANINLTEQTGATGSIPETGLPAGGMVVTVFDNNWQPIAERLCFVDHLKQNSFPVQITWEKKSLSKRGYNQLLITIPDSIPANLSLSVTDAGLPTDSINNNNIFSELLLTGDIRGRVYNPDYYFTDTTQEIKHNLDLVMMTHGWRKYDWNKIVKGEYPQIQYPKDTAYFTLSGKVTGISQKKIDAAKTLFVALKEADSSVQTQIISLNKDGSFAQSNILLFDSTKIYYRLNGIKGPASYINLKLNQPEIFSGLKNFNITRNTPIYAPRDAQATINLNRRQFFFMTKEVDKKAHQLADVKVSAHKKTQIEEMHDLYVNNPLFKGNGITASYFLDIEHSTTASVYTNGILDYLDGKIPGFRNGQWYYHGTEPIGFKYITDEGTPTETPPLIPMSNIAYIEAFPPPFPLGPLNGGIIAIYTRKGSDIDAETSNLTSATTKGYTPLKEFYQPNYGGKDSAKTEEDIRPTIYWNPILLTNKNANKIRLAFYNNDVTTGFKVILEGINGVDKITHVEEIIK